MNKVLIVPDIHGRKFWENDIAVMMADIDSLAIDVVFLGDYVDPYQEESISDKQRTNLAEVTGSGAALLSDLSSVTTLGCAVGCHPAVYSVQDCCIRPEDGKPPTAQQSR